MHKLMTIYQYLHTLQDNHKRIKNKEILKDFFNYKFDGGNLSFSTWANINKKTIKEKLTIMKNEGII